MFVANVSSRQRVDVFCMEQLSVLTKRLAWDVILLILVPSLIKN